MSETILTSPFTEIVNTPVNVSDVSAYGFEPDGGAQTVDMNGPETWFLTVAHLSLTSRIRGLSLVPSRVIHTKPERRMVYRPSSDCDAAIS